MSFPVGILPGTLVFTPSQYLTKGKINWMQKEILSTTGLRISKKSLRGLVAEMYETEFQGKGMPPSDYTMLDAVRAELYLRSTSLQSDYDPTRLRMYENEQQLTEERRQIAETCPEKDCYWAYKTKEAYDSIYNPNTNSNYPMYKRLNMAISRQYFRDINSNCRAMDIGESTDQEKTANKGLELPYRFINQWNFNSKTVPDDTSYSLPSFADTY